jgi:acetolactate synthase I/II/III large subunit
VHDVRQVMPEDGIVTLDNGTYKIWFARHCRTRVANTVLLDNALATMGACRRRRWRQCCTPERRVLAVCGDGGFMMNSREMATAARLGLSPVVLIPGQCLWHDPLKRAVDGFANWRLSFGNPNFVKYARGVWRQGPAGRSG